jgi:enamine deaminase RidA (YjgF/YER057c/UK114 family)
VKDPTDAARESLLTLLRPACNLPQPFHIANHPKEALMSQNIVRHEPGAILSRAVEYNGMVFLAGLTADDYSLDIKGQTEQVLKKIDKYLAAAGTSKSRLISAVIYINKMANKEDMNKVWQVWMDKANPPARACVEAQLGSPNTLLEIMVTAAK